jgi:translation initiation factor IF-3
MKSRKDDNKKKEPRVDRRIRVPKVLVIDADGTRLGEMQTYQALRLAQDQGLNLVEVSPNSDPPVCRVLDYGKFKYEQKQEAKRRRKNQVVVELKEVKFRPKVDKHDFETKVRHAMRFLAEGDKVKFTIMFRGRELAHPEVGDALLARVLAEFTGKVLVDQEARREGRNLTAVVQAKPGAFPKPVKPVAPADGQRPATSEGGSQDLDPDDDDELDEGLDDDLDEDDEDEDEDEDDEAGVPASMEG